MKLNHRLKFLTTEIYYELIEGDENLYNYFLFSLLSCLYLYLKLSYTILVIALILGIISGIGIRAFMGSVVEAMKEESSMNTILAVIMVSLLGGLMKHYNILDKTVESIQQIICNKKIILMIIPAIIGILIILGGALLSAQFINDIGSDRGIKPVEELLKISYSFSVKYIS